MKRSVYLIAVLMFITSTVMSQGAINGTIYIRMSKVDNKEVVEPLKSASVYVTYGGNKIGTTTNNHGDYTIRPLQPGVYVVVIYSPLIDTVIIPDITVSGSEISFVKDIVMDAGKKLGKFVVTADRPLKEGSPSKHQIKGPELGLLPDPGNINQIVELFGGAWVSDNGRQISFRGARIGDALYVVDGVRQRSTDVSLPNRSIGTMNVWNGGVPAEYGDFTGGVVVIETLSYFDWENQQEVKRLIAKKNAADEEFRRQKEEKAKNESPEEG